MITVANLCVSMYFSLFACSKFGFCYSTCKHIIKKNKTKTHQWNSLSKNIQKIKPNLNRILLLNWGSKFKVVWNYLLVSGVISASTCDICSTVCYCYFFFGSLSTLFLKTFSKIRVGAIIWVGFVIQFLT